MNKRIKELAEQAGIDVTQDTFVKFGGLELPINKFAELIVKECARVASETVIECEGIDFDLVRECYEHFGIEP